MRLIRNYILEEILSHLWMTLFTLTFVLLLGNVFTKMFDLVINRGVDILRIVQIFLYSTPFLLVFTIPMSCLVAVLLTFGRLSADRELTAFRASGISLRRLIRAPLIMAFVISLFCLYLNDQLATRSHFKVRQLSSEIGMQTPTAVLEEGVFIKEFKDLILFIHRIDGNVLHQIRIYQPQKNAPARTIIAERGELIPLPEQNVIKLHLMNGTSDEPDPDNPGRFYKLKFGTYFLPLDISGMKAQGQIQKKRKELTIRELYAIYQKLKFEGFTDPYTMTEIHEKIAMAFAAFVLSLVAIPLAIRTHRGERAIGFALALILGTVYWAIFIGATSLSKMGFLKPWIIMHLPNAIFILLGALLTLRVLKK